MTVLLASGTLTLITFLVIGAFGLFAFWSMRRQIAHTDVPWAAEVAHNRRAERQAGTAADTTDEAPENSAPRT